MFYTNSIYARNKKDKTAIIYLDANRRSIRLTADDFASEQEFMRWKAWSDEDFHVEEKQDHRYTSHTLMLDAMGDHVMRVTSPEESLLEEWIQQARRQICAEMVVTLQEKLTEKQFRRIWMRYVDGLLIKEIATAEHVTGSRITESIISAKKKARKIFPNGINDLP